MTTFQARIRGGAEAQRDKPTRTVSPIRPLRELPGSSPATSMNISSVRPRTHIHP